MKILLDTNVVLDLLLAREPFVDMAREIFNLIENNELEGFLCATSVTTLHYLIGRSSNKNEADSIVRDLLTLFSVSAVDHKILFEASVNNGKDYEDSVIYTSAYLNNIDFIISRDKSGFSESQVSTLTPQEFLAFFHSR